ncbi:hypothetical protein Noda2021_03590 [Candidatus Dependentiae bacterium Noda2021]|nr:hypothetical protein Noda2021_03590 [Candidatus Dependentiae bacterium Noda2021]
MVNALVSKVSNTCSLTGTITVVWVNEAVSAKINNIYLYIVFPISSRYSIIKPYHALMVIIKYRALAIRRNYVVDVTLNYLRAKQSDMCHATIGNNAPSAHYRDKFA